MKEMDEAALEALLFKIVGGGDPRRRVPIDQRWVHREIRRAGMTLYQLWLEYREAAKDGPTVEAEPYRYSQFCERYALTATA